MEDGFPNNFSDYSDDEADTAVPSMLLEERAVEGYYGLAMEVEAMNVHFLGGLQLVALALASTTITLAIPFYAWLGALLEEHTIRVCVSMLLHWIVTILVIVMFWPLMKANYSTRLKVRIIGFMANVVLAVVAWLLLFMFVPFKPQTTVSDIAILVIHCGGLGLELLVCIVTLCRSLRSGPGKFTLSSSEMRRAHVRWLVRNALRHPRVIRDDTGGMIDCLDGTKHSSVHELLAHCAQQGIDRTWLLDEPPRRWTAQGAAQLQDNLPPNAVKHQVATPGICTAARDYFCPWRRLPASSPRRNGSKEDADRPPIVFFYPTRVLFMLASLLATSVVLCAFLFESIPSVVNSLRSQGAKLETCGGIGVCSYFVDVEEAVGRGFHVAAHNFLQVNTSSAGFEAAIATRQAALDAIINVTGITSGSAFGVNGGELYQQSDGSFRADLISTASSFPFLTPGIWDRASTFRVYDAISVANQTEYAAKLNISAEDLHAVNIHKIALKDSLKSALMDKKICLDHILSSRNGKRTEGGCQRTCGETPTSDPFEYTYLGSCLMWDEIANASEISMLVGVCGAAFFALLSIVQTTYGYKAKVLQIRHGVANFSYAAKSFSPHIGGYLFGCALSCMLLGIFVLAFTIGFCVFIFMWRPTREWFWEPNVRNVWVPWGISGVFFAVVTAPLWIVTIDWKFRTVKRAKGYSLLTMSMTLASITSASILALFRLLYMILFVVIGFMRVDVSLFPNAAITMDTPYASFLATIAMHEPTTNPCAATFVELLLDKPTNGKRLTKLHCRLRNRLRLALLLSANPSLQTLRDRRSKVPEGKFVKATSVEIVETTQDDFQDYPKYF